MSAAFHWDVRSVITTGTSPWQNRLTHNTHTNINRACAVSIAYFKRAQKKKQLRRPKFSLEDVIKMDRKEIVSEDINWISPAHDRFHWRALVNLGKEVRVP